MMETTSEQPAAVFAARSCGLPWNSLAVERIPEMFPKRCDSRYEEAGGGREDAFFGQMQKPCHD